MVDAETVIKGMEKIYESYVDSEIVERHDYGDTRTADIFKQNASIINDALELLKAQEPVEPYGQYSVHTGTKYIVCGACEKPLCMMKDSYRPKYCPECGRMVKWHANETQK